MGGFMISLNTASANSITVQGTPKGGYALTINYDQATTGIAINSIVNPNNYWEYRTFNFVKSSSQKKQPQPPAQPPAQSNPNPNPPPNEMVADPDMHGEEPQPMEFVEDPDMHMDEPRPDEFFEDPDMHMDEPRPDEFFEEPYMQPGGQPRLGFVPYITFSVVGLGLILCVLLLIKLNKNKANTASKKDSTSEQNHFEI